MSPDELEIQKIFVNVFEELKHEQKNYRSEMHKLGYKQRGELYKHINSGYNNHEALNKAMMDFKKNGVKNKVNKWVYDLFVEHRDLYGYFENYQNIIKEIDILLNRSVETEMYDIAEFLTYWRDKLKY